MPLAFEGSDVIEGLGDGADGHARPAAFFIEFGQEQQVVKIRQVTEPLDGTVAKRAVAMGMGFHVVAMRVSVRGVMAPSRAASPAETWSAGSIALPTSCNKAARRNSSSYGI